MPRQTVWLIQSLPTHTHTHTHTHTIMYVLHVCTAAIPSCPKHLENKPQRAYMYGTYVCTYVDVRSVYMYVHVCSYHTHIIELSLQGTLSIYTDLCMFKVLKVFEFRYIISPTHFFSLSPSHTLYIIHLQHTNTLSLTHTLNDSHTAHYTHTLTHTLNDSHTAHHTHSHTH